MFFEGCIIVVVLIKLVSLFIVNNIFFINCFGLIFELVNLYLWFIVELIIDLFKLSFVINFFCLI